MHLEEFCTRLDERLDTAAYAAVDASANGLQVGPSTGRVDRAAFAVDAARATIDRAVGMDADVLVTHHGLIWDGLDRITGRTYDRIAALVDGRCALYVSHLPLDGHPELGNAAGLAESLGLTDPEPFGEYEGETVGLRGPLPAPVPIDDLVETVAADLETGDSTVRLLPFGPDDVQDVAVVTGSGTDWLDEAAAAEADVLVTGEGKQAVYHAAREAGLHVVLGGHYATETFGVRALSELVANWGVETTFVECPTGL